MDTKRHVTIVVNDYNGTQAHATLNKHSVFNAWESRKKMV